MDKELLEEIIEEIVIDENNPMQQEGQQEVTEGSGE